MVYGQPLQSASASDVPQAVPQPLPGAGHHSAACCMATSTQHQQSGTHLQVLALLTSAKQLLRRGVLSEAQLQEALLAQLRQPGSQAHEEFASKADLRARLPAQHLVAALNEHVRGRPSQCPRVVVRVDGQWLAASHSQVEDVYASAERPVHCHRVPALAAALPQAQTHISLLAA